MAKQILRPANPVTESIVHLDILDRTIYIYLPAFSDELRLLAKSLRYQWASPRWQRIIGYQAGDIKDRLTETAYKLLEANFIISVDEKLVNDIIDGNYIAEHTRWICLIDCSDQRYQDWIGISWSRTEDFYLKARKLPNSRWLKPFVAVNPVEWEQIIDFAHLYDFRFTPKAQEALFKAQQQFNQQIRVELGPKQIQEKIVKKEILGEIADEFRDQD